MSAVSLLGAALRREIRVGAGYARLVDIGLATGLPRWAVIAVIDDMLRAGVGR